MKKRRKKGKKKGKEAYVPYMVRTFAYICVGEGGEVGPHSIWFVLRSISSNGV
jgi:hypothetical protein